MFDHNAKIYIAGHTGLLGSALLKQLKRDGYTQLITKTHQELELTCKQEVEAFFQEQRPEYVFLCAGKVGGIIGNKEHPASYLHVNLAIQDILFEMCVKYDVKHMIFYGSSCTYPKLCAQPMKEEYWLTGAIEETSMGYAAAKIAGILGCKSYNNEYGDKRFICVIPNSMYGPNDNFDPQNSHVLSALLKKLDDARIKKDANITLWGSGTPRREFIFSEDVANASIFLMENADKLENTHYNLGTGVDYSIQELAETIALVVGFQGELLWDTSKPDGTPRKLLDSRKFLALGWQPSVTLEKGLEKTYAWYKEQYGNA